MAEPKLGVSVLIPTLNETSALAHTVNTVLAQSAHDVLEIVLIVGKRTTPACHQMTQTLCAQHPERVRVIEQQRPYLGGALRDGFAAAQGTHVLMMAADLETPPEVVPAMIDGARDGTDIVTATRWGQGGSFARSYGTVKLALNWGFQGIFKRMYGTRLSDLTYGFRLMRARWVKDIAFDELGHALMLETLIKPLRLGATVKEVPCAWQARSEGTSSNSYKQMASYVPVVLRTRLRPAHQLWRDRGASA